MEEKAKLTFVHRYHENKKGMLTPAPDDKPELNK